MYLINYRKNTIERMQSVRMTMKRVKRNMRPVSGRQGRAKEANVDLPDIKVNSVTYMSSQQQPYGSAGSFVGPHEEESLGEYLS